MALIIGTIAYTFSFIVGTGLTSDDKDIRFASGLVGISLIIAKNMRDKKRDDLDNVIADFITESYMTGAIMGAAIRYLKH